MILRLLSLISVLSVAGTLYVLVVEAPRAYQAVPSSSEFGKYIASGAIPDVSTLRDNEDLGHDVFEEPEEDAVRLAAIKAMLGTMNGMPGMNMGDGAMKMDDPKPEAMADPGAMKMDDPKPEAMADAGAMKMDDPKPEAMADAGTMKMDDPKPETMADAGAMKMDDSEPGETEEHESTESVREGLRFLPVDTGNADREIEIVMTEWTYSPGSIQVKPGERILLNVRNGGQLPHEFMFMSMLSMQAVAYRGQRADWNLLEHEAIYERSLVMPGQSFQILVEVEQPGMWMFMCMFPYHMQFGMMGGIVTPGISMPGMQT